MRMFDLTTMWMKAYEILEASDRKDKTFKGRNHRIVFCDLLLAELKKLQGKDLEPFLGESTFNIYEMMYKLTLQFPFSKLCSDSATITELESDSEGGGDAASV